MIFIINLFTAYVYIKKLSMVYFNIYVHNNNENIINISPSLIKVESIDNAKPAEAYSRFQR